MRPPLPGRLLAAAVLLLTACGGSADEAASPGSSAGTSSGSTARATAGTAAARTDSGFCSQAAQVLDDVSSTFTGNSDPSTLPTVLQDVADTIGQIEPPATLATDWAAFGDGIQQVAAAARINFDDPSAVAAFQQEVAGLQQEFGTAFGNVGNYLTQTCGIPSGAPQSGSPGGAAPPS